MRQEDLRHHNTIFDNINLTMVRVFFFYTPLIMLQSFFFRSMSIVLDSFSTKPPPTPGSTGHFPIFQLAVQYSPATKVDIVSNIAKDGD